VYTISTKNGTTTKRDSKTVAQLKKFEPANIERVITPLVDCTENPYFVVDEDTIEFQYLGDEGCIIDYAGMSAFAELDYATKIKVVISALALDRICAMWGDRKPIVMHDDIMIGELLNE